jgi:transcriptional regulator of acetoin/glycerol metabolism
LEVCLKRGIGKNRMSPSRRKTRRERAERRLVQLRKALGIKTLDEIKRNEITRVLVLAKGDKLLTAALLGVGKSTVYRLLEE